MSLKILLSMTVARMPSNRAPFWREQTRRLVVIVERTSPRKLTAWGVDPDLGIRDAFVFQVTFPARRLPDVIAAVLGKKTAFNPKARPLGASQFAVAVAPSDPGTTGIVVPDQGGSGGPKVQLFALARKLLTSNASVAGPPGDGGGDGSGVRSS